MRFFVMGGGCYGTFYARQLLRADAAGALRVHEVAIVDSAPLPRALARLGPAALLRHYRQTWDDFLDSRLGDGSGEPSTDGDILVTPPFTPHLALAWLLRTLPGRGQGLGWQLEPFTLHPPTPFHHQAEGGPLNLSHADWICPINCIEPERCPRTRAPRDWDMDRTARALAASLAAAGQPVDVVELFHCHHIAYGVGGYPLARLPAAADSILRVAKRGAQRPGCRVRALVGTVSHCHGTLHLLTASAGMEREANSALFPPMANTPNPDDRVR